MGTKLLPAHQVKNMIEKLVRSGAISGDKAEGWQKRVKEQDELRELQQDAEGGDASAMQRWHVPIFMAVMAPCRFGRWIQVVLTGRGGGDAMCRYQTALCYLQHGCRKEHLLGDILDVADADTEVGSRLGCIMATFAGCAFARIRSRRARCIESWCCCPALRKRRSGPQGPPSVEAQ